MSPRILLADDHTLVLEMLVSFLRQDFTVVGTVHDGEALLEAAVRLQPDLVVLEHALAGVDSLTVVRTLRTRVPAVRCVLVTRHADLHHVRDAFAAGACGYILKDTTPQELVDALLQISRGATYISPRLGLEKGWAPPTAVTREGSGELTARQMEVLCLIAEGCTGKQIASTLGISLKTVESHKACISRQLGLRSTAAFTRHAVEHGLVRPRDSAQATPVMPATPVTTAAPRRAASAQPSMASGSSKST